MSLDPKDIERLSSYLDDALPPAERRRVEELLSSRADAREALAGMKAARRSVKDLPLLTPPEALYQRVMRDVRRAPERRPFFSFFPFKTVGALAAAALVVVATHDFWRPETREARQAEFLKSAPPSPLQMFQAPAEARQSSPLANVETLGQARGSRPAMTSTAAAPARNELLLKDARLDGRRAPPAPSPALRDELKAAGKPSAAARKVLAGGAAPSASAESSAMGGIVAAPAPAPAEKAKGLTVQEGAVSFLQDAGEPRRLPGAKKRAAEETVAKKESDDAPARIMPLIQEGHGESSGIRALETATVRSPEAWKALWARHAPGQPAPAVDFSRTLVLAVFAGEKPTGGWSVRIDPVRAADGHLQARYRVLPPPAGGFAAQVLTQPFQWVAVPAAGAPVEFIPQ